MDPSPLVPDQYGGPTDGIGARTYIKRSLLCLLRPLTGTRSTGVATVQATGADVAIPANSYAIPLVGRAAGSGGAQADYQRLVKVTTATTVSAAGTAVPIYTALGGAYQQLPVGTKLRWSPTIPGVEADSEVTTAVEGGASLSAPGALRRIVLFDRLGISPLTLQRGPTTAGELWRSKVGDFPAGILALMGSRKGDRVGRGLRLHRFSWRLFVADTRYDSTEDRYNDGDTTLDWAEGLLENSGDVDEQALSVPRIEVGDARLLVTEDGAFLHTLDFETFWTIQHIESRTFDAWTEAEIIVVTPPGAEYPDSDDAIPVVGPVNVHIT